MTINLAILIHYVNALPENEFNSFITQIYRLKNNRESICICGHINNHSADWIKKAVEEKEIKELAK